jgi:hypothetical protein
MDNQCNVCAKFILINASLNTCIDSIDISQYRLLFGFSLLFHLNCLTAQLFYEGRAEVEGANSISKFDHHNINGGAVDDT